MGCLLPDSGEHDRSRMACARSARQPVRGTYFAVRQLLEKSAQVVPRSAPLAFMFRHCMAQLRMRARSATWFVCGSSEGACPGVDAAGGRAAGADCRASLRPTMVLCPRTGAEMPARRTATARVRNGRGIILCSAIRVTHRAPCRPALDGQARRLGAAAILLGRHVPIINVAACCRNWCVRRLPTCDRRSSTRSGLASQAVGPALRPAIWRLSRGLWRRGRWTW